MEILNKVLYKLHIKKRPPRDFNKGKKELPPPVKEILEAKGTDTSAFITVLKLDMNNSECFSDCYLAFDTENIYYAEFTEPVVPLKKSEKKLEFKPELLNFVTVPLNKTDEMFTEQHLSTFQITYKFEGEYYSLCFATLNRLAQAEEFVRVFNALKSGKDYKKYLLDENEFKCKKCGAPLPPGKPFCDKCVNKKSTVKRLFSFFGEAKGKMVFIIIAILIKSGISLILPQFSTQELYDKVLSPSNTLPYDTLLNSLISLVLTVAGLKIANQLFTLVYEYIIAGMLPKIIYSIKLKIFSSMQKLSVNFYTHKQTGNLMERVTRDSNNIYWFFVDGFPYVITSAVTIIGILAVMFCTSVKLTLAILGTSVIIFAGYPIFDKMFRKRHHKVWLWNSRLTSKVSDNITGHRIIKAFSKESEELTEFEKISTQLKDAEIDSSDLEATVFPTLMIVVYLLSAIVLGYGGILVVKYHELTVGQLLKFIVYLQMIQGPFDFLTWVSNWWAKCVDSAQRVFEITDTEPDIKEKENPVSLGELRGDIELNELMFEYEPARPVIKNLSLKVNAGEMLGIVGKTGAGKTTISNLIARLYDPKDGVVKIDGVDVKDLKMSELRKNIGIVSQDIFLFMGSVADNIRYAKPDATNEEVIAAAKAASAHGFITKLPDGYETFVGSGGQSLSGGEKQRISIARTIIQNPKILILDEATAAMDTETERNIQNSLAELKSGRTTIAIAHRLSTLRDADKLAVIDNGECIEYGTYKELMDKKGEYYRLYKIQEQALKFIGIGEESADTEKREHTNEH